MVSPLRRARCKCYQTETSSWAGESCPTTRVSLFVFLREEALTNLPSAEYSPNGTLIHDVSLGAGGTTLHSYRATKVHYYLRSTFVAHSSTLTSTLLAQASWTGLPLTRPSFAIDTLRDDRAYASWNGATEVTHWRLLGGSRPKLLSRLEETRKLGFETELFVSSRNDYFAVAAYDAKVSPLTNSPPSKADAARRPQGKCLGVSETHHWSNGTTTGIGMQCSGVTLVDHTSSFVGLFLLVRSYLLLRLLSNPALNLSHALLCRRQWASTSSFVGGLDCKSFT
jgi:uncharacterized membrane protein